MSENSRCLWAAAACLLLAASSTAETSPSTNRVLILPLAPAGYAAPMDSLELGERLRSAVDGIPSLSVTSKGVADSLFGARGVDVEGCASASGCMDGLAAMASARFVLWGSFGRLGPKGYLVLTLRDSQAHRDLPLRSRSWQSRLESETALASVANEIAARAQEVAGRSAGLLSLPQLRMAPGKALHERDVSLAMTLGFLPGGGFVYLQRYDLAAAYLGAELAAGLPVFLSLGRADDRGAALFAVVLVVLEFGGILHTGIEARRQNRAQGFVTLNLSPPDGTRRLGVEVARRF